MLKIENKNRDEIDSEIANLKHIEILKTGQ